MTQCQWARRLALRHPLKAVSQMDSSRMVITISVMKILASIYSSLRTTETSKTSIMKAVENLRTNHPAIHRTRRLLRMPSNLLILVRLIQWRMRLSMTDLRDMLTTIRTMRENSMITWQKTSNYQMKMHSSWKTSKAICPMKKEHKMVMIGPLRTVCRKLTTNCSSDCNTTWRCTTTSKNSRISL